MGINSSYCNKNIVVSTSYGYASTLYTVFSQSDHTVYVNIDGVIDEDGKYANYYGIYVRPALWIDLGD